MGYLICIVCNHYYEISSEEELFEFCSCGRKLEYYEYLDDYLNRFESKNRFNLSYLKKKEYEHDTIMMSGVFLSYFGIMGIIYGNFWGILLVLIGIYPTYYGYANGKSWYKGHVGEKIVKKSLKKLRGGHHVFNDIILPGSMGNIDHVVVGPSGIFVIESKNLGGLHIVEGDNWSAKYKEFGGFKKSHKSPGKQAKANAAHLRKYLMKNDVNMNDVWVKSVVALNSLHVIRKNDPKDYELIHPKYLVEFIHQRKSNIRERTINESFYVLREFCDNYFYME